MKGTILLVDDEELVLKTLEKVFVKDGYDVLTARNGEDALALMDKHKIRVFLLDLNMPGMPGIELCKKIKEKDHMTCVYALTGYSEDYALEECREAGFDDYFVKPFKIDQMLKMANEAFEKQLRWEYQEQMGKDQ